LNVSAVDTDGPLSDGESEAGSTCRAGARIIDAVKTVEDFVDMLRCYTRTGIYNFEVNGSGLSRVD
jgi:hypothetical protein